MTDLIYNGLITMEEALGNPVFTWKGENFLCVPNTVNDISNVINTGFNEDADFRMTVRLDQFTEDIYPALNDWITYLNYRFLVRQIKKPAHNVFWVYVLELPKIK